MNKFGEIIRHRREEKDLLLRHVAAQLDIDTAMLSKVERGERNAKREHVLLISQILELEHKQLLTLWLADKVYEVIEDEEVGLNALKVAEEEISPYQKSKFTNDAY
jgi:transcriptional regulator with XRE-family HTH domain